MAEAADAGEIIDPTLEGRTMWRAIAWGTAAIAATAGWVILSWFHAIYWPLLAVGVLAQIRAPALNRDIRIALEPYLDGRPLAVSTVLMGPSPVVKAADGIKCVMRMNGDRVTMTTLGGGVVIDTTADQLSVRTGGSQTLRIDQVGGGFVEFRIGRSALDLTSVGAFNKRSHRETAELLDRIRASHVA